MANYKVISFESIPLLLNFLFNSPINAIGHTDASMVAILVSHSKAIGGFEYEMVG